MKPYYEHNGITIYHGDCRDVMTGLIEFDVILTDPPYNVNLGGKKKHSQRQVGYISTNDLSATYIDLVEFTSEMIDLAKAAVVTPGNINQNLWPAPSWTMAWIKKNGCTRTPLTRGTKMMHACWEPILIYGQLANPCKFDIFEIPITRQGEVEDHPCPKPIKLFRRLVEMLNPQDIIIDFFMGSGTTLLAAKELGRKAIGIELEEKYCEIAVRRLKQEILPGLN